jgi:hypothetical protein
MKQNNNNLTKNYKITMMVVVIISVPLEIYEIGKQTL